MVAVELTRLVDEIREQNLSRNRHFRLMSRGPYRAAMRLKRYLDGLAAQLRELAASGDLDAQLHRPAPGRVWLRITVARLQVERHCHLSEEELECLCRHHPDVRPLLAAGAGGQAPVTRPSRQEE